MLGDPRGPSVPGNRGRRLSTYDELNRNARKKPGNDRGHRVGATEESRKGDIR